MFTGQEDKIRAVVKRHRPRGWRVRESKRRVATLTGEANWNKKTIYCPTLDTREGLFVFLHECGHIHFKHFQDALPITQEEYEADRYAISIMQIEGIQVPKTMVDISKHNLRWYSKKFGSNTYIEKWIKK